MQLRTQQVAYLERIAGLEAEVRRARAAAEESERGRAEGLAAYAAETARHRAEAEALRGRLTVAETREHQLQGEVSALSNQLAAVRAELDARRRAEDQALFEVRLA